MSRRTRIKVCGITTPADASMAVAAGVDAIGLVFYEPSPRHVDLAQAAAISREIPAFVDIVALFVDPEAAAVEAVLDAVKPDILQFHGEESPAFCEGFRRSYIKAVRVQAGTDIEAQAQRYGSARGLLLDSYQPGVPGGTGTTFDWDLVPPTVRSRVVLAGGLTPDNVGQAIELLQPFAVDVSGGVEQARGVKDATKVRRFVQAVRQADQQIVE